MFLWEPYPIYLYLALYHFLGILSREIVFQSFEIHLLESWSSFSHPKLLRRSISLPLQFSLAYLLGWLIITMIKCSCDFSFHWFLQLNLMGKKLLSLLRMCHSFATEAKLLSFCFGVSCPKIVSETSMLLYLSRPLFDKG